MGESRESREERRWGRERRNGEEKGRRGGGGEGRRKGWEGVLRGGKEEEERRGKLRREQRTWREIERTGIGRWKKASRSYFRMLQ